MVRFSQSSPKHTAYCEFFKVFLLLLTASYICSSIDSSELQSHLATATPVNCNVTLETYACAQVRNNIHSMEYRVDTK